MHFRREESLSRPTLSRPESGAGAGGELPENATGNGPSSVLSLASGATLSMLHRCPFATQALLSESFVRPRGPSDRSGVDGDVRSFGPKGNGSPPPLAADVSERTSNGAAETKEEERSSEDRLLERRL